MNTKTTHRKRMHDASLTDALTKGALVWGPVYSIGASTAAYWASRLATGSTPAYGDIVADSLMIFPLLGIISGTIKWRLVNPTPRITKIRRKINRRNRMNRFFSGNRFMGMRPRHA